MNAPLPASRQVQLRTGPGLRSRCPAVRGLQSPLYDYRSATHPDRSCGQLPGPASTPCSRSPPQLLSPSASSPPRPPEHQGDAAGEIGRLGQATGELAMHAPAADRKLE